MSKYIALAAAVTVAALLIVHAQDANGIKFRTDARAQDSEAANLIRLGEEAAKRGNRSYGIWLYSAGLADFAREVGQRNINSGSLPIPFSRDSNAGRPHAGRASICR